MRICSPQGSRRMSPPQASSECELCHWSAIYWCGQSRKSFIPKCEIRLQKAKDTTISLTRLEQPPQMMELVPLPAGARHSGLSRTNQVQVSRFKCTPLKINSPVNLHQPAVLQSDSPSHWIMTPQSFRSWFALQSDSPFWIDSQQAIKY